MFTFKEPFNNPADELAYAKSLVVCLNDLASQGAKEMTLSQNGTIGLSLILETVCNIIDSAERKLTTDGTTICHEQDI